MKIAVAGATGRVGRHAVEVLQARGHDVVPISRSSGVDVITAEGLAEATEFFTTATRNLQQAGTRAGVKRIIVVSIIGIDRFTVGYAAAKVVHENAMLSGPIPVRILRAAQFHEFVGQLVEWGRQGDVSRLQKMRTHLVAARTVAETLADLAANGAVRGAGSSGAKIMEIAGPRAGLLPGPNAILGGPTFEAWLEAAFR